jgi:hypothetical protein
MIDSIDADLKAQRIDEAFKPTTREINKVMYNNGDI